MSNDATPRPFDSEEEAWMRATIESANRDAPHGVLHERRLWATLDECRAQLAAAERWRVTAELLSESCAKFVESDAELRIKLETADAVIQSCVDGGFVVALPDGRYAINNHRAMAAEERARGMETALEGITTEFEGTVREADNRAAGSRGMQVPFHGDFAAALQLPSVVGRIRWWARTLRAALATKKAP